MESYCKRRKIRDRTQIDVYAAEPEPMRTAGPEPAKQLRQMVESRGITYHPEHQITEVDAAARRLRFKNGAEAAFDVLAYVPPHRAPRVVKDAGLTNESGWVPVDRGTFQTSFANVYAVGDVTSVPLKMGRPLPKAGVFAHGQAEVVAHNIIHEVTGKGSPKTYTGEGECFIEIGGGKAGIGRGNFYAEPTPQVKLKPPGRRWHIAKVMFEKFWLWRWF
jgi:sulfide:quinone oxidoreductase